MVTGGGQGMNSVRETIEWSYKDLKTQWKFMDYKHCLQLRKQPLAKIVFTCLLLKNVHCTMYGNQQAGYFDMKPPLFEDWISQGARAHPIPSDSMFHPNYVLVGEENNLNEE
jgi:hypothetical protein